jgi:AcrR family transcriptional regulator
VSADDGAAPVLAAAAVLLAERPYAEVSLDDVADAAGLTVDDVVARVGDLHAVASAVLTAEGGSMRAAMAAARERSDGPLDVLVTTFRLVGANIATRVEVRAGMRLAAESHRYFPERRIDPYRTWRAFVVGQLTEAEERGLLQPGVDVEEVAWLLVSAGMGTKGLLEFRDAWNEAPRRLEVVAATAVSLVAAPTHAAG